MPRPAAPDADPRKLARDAAHKERRRLGLVLVTIGGERLDMHADDAATLYAEARELQRARALPAVPQKQEPKE
jgi:hypothetical protein